MIELLVVIAIITLLLAILLPAIQSSREAARQTVCRSNLKQLALAVSNHEATHGYMPEIYGGTFLSQPLRVVDEFYFHSWRSSLLPYVEQTALFEELDWTQVATSERNQKSINTTVPIFICPSTSNPTRNVPEIGRYNPIGVGIGFSGSAARSDYEILCGVYQPGPASGSGLAADFADITSGSWGKSRYVDAPNFSDVVNERTYPKSKFRDITDGLSNTILIAEKAGRPDLYQEGQLFDAYPYEDPQGGCDNHQAAWGVSTHLGWLLVGLNPVINDENCHGVFAFHPGGANVAMGDGSVRFLSESTDSALLRSLITASAGDLVND